MTRGVPSDGKPVVQGTWQVHASLSRSSGGARAAGLDNRGRKGMSWDGGWWLELNDQVEPRSNLKLESLKSKVKGAVVTASNDRTLMSVPAVLGLGQTPSIS